MRITLNLDEGLIREARRLTGIRAKTDVIHEGLRTLIVRESARRLAALGGKLSAAKAPHGAIDSPDDGPDVTVPGRSARRDLKTE